MIGCFSRMVQGHTQPEIPSSCLKTSFLTTDMHNHHYTRLSAHAWLVRELPRFKPYREHVGYSHVSSLESKRIQIQKLTLSMKSSSEARNTWGGESGRSGHPWTPLFSVTWSATCRDGARQYPLVLSEILSVVVAFIHTRNAISRKRTGNRSWWRRYQVDD